MDRATATTLFLASEVPGEAVYAVIGTIWACKSMNSGREGMHNFDITSPHLSQDSGPRRTMPPATILLILMLPKALLMHNLMKAWPRARLERPSNLRKTMKIEVCVRHLPEIRLR
jgi:hypothetical protein